jgi:hypothetical protein
MRDLRFLFKTHYTNSRALVIGIDKYLNVSPLSYAVSDAKEIRQILIEELQFLEENITYLTDEEATKDAILKAYLSFAQENIELDERLLIFYAGHGHTITGSRGEMGFLIPYNANPSDLSTFIAWKDFTSYTEIIRAKHVLFIMDACYSGLALTRNLQPGSTRFLKDMMLRQSRQVLTAGKADEVVADAGGPIPNHSVFTGHLIEGLRGKAATQDGVITANGLMSYVYNKVANDKNSNQTPHYGYFDGDGDFIIQAPNLTELEKEEQVDSDRLIVIPYPDENEIPEKQESRLIRLKKLLANDSAAIELHDFLFSEVRRFLAATMEDGFRTNGQQLSPEQLLELFLERLTYYENASQDISILLACVAYWAKPVHKVTLQKVLARLTEPLEQQNNEGFWQAMRWYPLLHILYCAGIAAIDGQRFDSLAAIFYTPIVVSSLYQSETKELLFIAANAFTTLRRHEIFKKIPGHEQNYVPMSEYLFKILQPKLDDVLFIGKNYEQAFDTFEVFFALAVADLKLHLLGENYCWGPPGRFAWKYRGHNDNGPLGRIISEGRTQQDSWAPLQAGLFGGDYTRFDNVATRYTEQISGFGWS